MRVRRSHGYSWCDSRIALSVMAMMLSLVVVSIWTPNASATPTSPSNGFTFTVNSGDLTITGCSPSCNGSSVTIPSSIDGDTVTSIGNQAFYDLSLTSVLIPSSVLSINYFAFAYNSLTSVMIPSSVTSIGQAAFANNINLTSAMIGTSVTSIGDEAFESDRLTSVTIPSSVTSIGTDTFAYNSLTSVTFLGSAPSFGSSSFTNTGGPAYYYPSTSGWSSLPSGTLGPFTLTPILTSTTLSLVAPSSATNGSAITASSISATLASGSSPSGTITFSVFGPQASAPTVCSSTGTTVGTATVASNATYSPSAGYTPSGVGDFWWYASYAGDSSNAASASTCGAGMAETVVAAALTSTTLSLVAPSSATNGSAITASSISATLASGSSPSGTITFSVFGPQASAPTVCSSTGTTVGTATVASNATYSPSAGYTPSGVGDFWWYASYAGDSSNAASASTCGAGMAETVVAVPAPPITPNPTTTSTTTTTTTTTIAQATTTTIPPTTTTTTQKKREKSRGTLSPTTTTSIPTTTTTSSPNATPSGSAGSGNSGTAPKGNSGKYQTDLSSPPQGDVDIIFSGQPGTPLDNLEVYVHGQGFQPGSTVTIFAHSTPTELGTALVSDSGLFDSRVDVPKGLRVGGHHIIVYGTMQDGDTVAQQEAFTVATGGRLGSVGSIPPGALATDVAFVPSSHPASVLGTFAVATTAIGALSLALGGGGGAGGSKANRNGYLEDVELEREEREVAGGSRGDRSRTWRWPWTRLLDRLSKQVPSRVAAISPVAGRVLVDGDYLRAMFGGAWLALCLGAIGLGTYAAASVGWYAFPPSLGLFLAILGLGVLDSTLGYLAGIAFVLSAALAGHLFHSTEIRLGAGIILLWFAVPLAASALRALRRNVHFDAASLWERSADLVVGGLFAAWVAQKMTVALSGLSGVELPINKSVNSIALFVLGFVTIRIVLETIAAHNYPKRLDVVHHYGELESGNLQFGLSLIVQILLFIFISFAFLGSSWPLYVGAAVFFAPLVPWLFADKIPKSKFVTKWNPRGLVLWTLVIVIDVLLSKLLSHVIHNDKLLEAVGFVLLPIPILISWSLELLEEEVDEEEQDDGEESELNVDVDVCGDDFEYEAGGNRNDQLVSVGSSSIAAVNPKSSRVTTTR